MARLSEALREASGGVGAYIVVEKILLQDEELRPVHGTTGYDFLDRANRLFVEAGNLPAIESIYSAFSGAQDSHEQIVYEQKERVMRDLFAGEMDRLAADLLALARERSCDLSLSDVQVALEEITAPGVPDLSSRV